VKILENKILQFLTDFVDAKFCYRHALADGNQRIWIRENTLEFSSVICTVSIPYLTLRI